MLVGILGDPVRPPGMLEQPLEALGERAGVRDPDASSVAVPAPG
jgi:hypothetical protein